MNNKCYIFSYNRGTFLKNCVASVEKHLGNDFDITIIDDHSKDQLTRKVLEEYAKKYRVIQPSVKFKSHHTGNFYANMNYAFKDALQSNTQLVLFIEDDMQMVRKVSKEDIERMILFFSKNPNTVQLHTNFLKRCNLKYKQYLVIDRNNKNAYFRAEKHPLNSCYCSNGIFYMPRVPEFIGSLKNRLGANEAMLKKRGCKLGFYAYPFMMWLPLPFSHRGGGRNFYHRIKEFIAGCGYYPYDEMSTALQNKLFNRSLDEFPYAEDYLRNSHCGHVKQWSFTGLNYAFKELGGWRIIFQKLFDFVDFEFIPKLKNTVAALKANKNIFNKIENQRNSKNFIWKFALFLKDILWRIKKSFPLITNKIKFYQYHKLNLLFIHIPKTGGKSICCSLQKIGLLKLIDKDYEKFKNEGMAYFSHKHIPCLLEQNIISKDYFNKSFKFCFVRNPWERMVSTYFELLKKKRLYLKRKNEENKQMDFIYFVKIIYESYKKTSSFDIGYKFSLPKYFSNNFNALTPQVKWIFDEEGKQIPDYIGRFENLEEDYKKACRKAGITYPPKLVWIDKSKRKKDYRNHYDTRTKKMVEEMYKQDINLFGYKY